MNKRYDRSPRINAVGLAAGSILALVVAMAVTFAFGTQPSDASTGTDVADTAVIYG
jgi:hypothetical protein